MSQQMEHKKQIFLIIVKAGIFFWMFSAVLIYILMFGPPEFWYILEKIGVWHFLKEIRVFLQPFFTADHLQ
jgi:hypothetical protein